MKRIFIVEDQEAIRRMLELNLTVSGYETVGVEDGGQAREKLESGEWFDLALVDVMLPVMDGFALMPLFRERDIPVIFLTAKGDLESKLTGLTGGAEDYIVKPFEMPELMVRMDKVLSRRGAQEREWRLRDVRVDFECRTVTRGGRLLPMTALEFDLLRLFIKNRNVALPREQLLKEVWGIRYEGGTRTVDVHVAKIRKKTGLHIVSVPKVGYRLEVDA